MKAVIKIATARKEFTQAQLAMLRRIMMVLREHDLSVIMEKKKKVTKKTSLNIKIA